MSISSIRRDYKLKSLSEQDTDPHPFRQFESWWQDALSSEIDEVNAMVLSTVSSSGTPSSRVVLLKDFDDRGFVFYTNYESRKGTELATNPNASLLFFWKELERQVRVEGLCEKVSAEESDQYFLSRPSGSQLGAWASPQSREVASRQVLEDAYHYWEQKQQQGLLGRPAHWGGYRIVPTRIEFWQGRPNRLHDRLAYQKNERGEWNRIRLAP